MNINEVLTIVNIFGAIWICVCCVSASHISHPDRDAKPLVLPIFVALSYVPLATIACLNDGGQELFERTVKLMLESLWLLSTFLFIRSYHNDRGKHHD